jgi:nucleoside-diphosphate kinase
MQNPIQEKTFVLIKPDGVKRGLIGEIIRRIEQRGLKIVALQMIHATPEDIDKHYPKDESWIRALGEKTLAVYKKYGYDPIKEHGTDDPLKIGMEVRKWNIDFLTSGPMVKMVVQGVHAIDMVRKLVGNTIPSLAEMGTIRGDFSVDSPVLANKQHRAIRNLIHASGNPAEASHEISMWFSEQDIHEYKRAEDDTMF